jgi:hypothetical protein
VSVNRLVAGLFGILWLAAGAGSIVAARHIPFASAEGVKVVHGEFDVNGLHGALMLLAGAALLVAALAGHRAARIANKVVGGLWVVLDVFALYVGKRHFNVVALHDTGADVLLVAGLVLVAVGTVVDLPSTEGVGLKYRTVEHGQQPIFVDESDLPPGTQRG